MLVKRSSVWVVDDSPTASQMARQALSASFDVTLFSDGVTMLERLHTEGPPDVLVTDWNMPGMSGIEVCSYLRSRPETSELAILMCTGTFRRTEDIVDALATGANDFLVKPFVDAELVARVNALLRSRSLAKRIAQAEAQTRALLDELPDPVIVIDDQGGLLLVNRQAAALFPAPRATTLAELLPSLSLASLEETHEPVEIAGRVYSPAGRGIELREQSAHIVTLRDVTEQVTALRARDEFLAMLAHELRNPLAPIVTALELMQRTPGDRDLGARGQVIIARQVRRLCRLVDDLLDVSRVTRGKVQLQTEDVDLLSVATAAIEGVESTLRERQHTLELKRPATPMIVKGDPLRLEQVLTNLLTNAARYTEPGGHITLSLDGDDDEVRLRVKDSGIGIPRETLPRIFDMFVQGHRELDRGEGGLGIGLTLVRRITEAHGGSVEARSDGTGRGSEFIVRLPRSPDRPAAQGATSSSTSGSAAAPERAAVRVLIVDDNVDAAELLGEMLVEEGDEVRIVFEGIGALAAARAFRPDVVILDIGLPGLDGYQVARQIRHEAEVSGALLVAVTGYGQSDDRRRTAEAGFDAHLVKPLRLEELHQLIAKRFPSLPMAATDPSHGV